MVAGEIIGWVIVIAGSGAFIHWLAWILEGLPDALDYPAGKFTDAWGDWPALHPEFRGVKASAGTAAGGGAKGADLQGNQLSHSQVPASHSGTGGL